MAKPKLQPTNPYLTAASASVREQLFRALFDTMRQGLAISVDALEPTGLEQIAERSRTLLKSPWSIGREEQDRDLARHGLLVVAPPRRGAVGALDEATMIRATPRSSIAKSLVKILGQDVPLGVDDDP